MRVVTSQEGAVTVIKPLGPMVSGELDDIDKNLFKYFNNWTKRIVINMSEVVFIDSAGLELLVHHHRQFNSHGLELKICSLNEMMQKILSLTRLSRRFESYPDSATAIRSFL